MPVTGFTALLWAGLTAAAIRSVLASPNPAAGDFGLQESKQAFIVRDIVAGYPSSFRPLKRAIDPNGQATCSGNGTNYCFGNAVSFCAVCGTCCSVGGGQYCCGANATCCGNGCCASGQTCSNGQCLLPVVTVVVTDVATVTATQPGPTVTVIGEVLITSFITSTVDVSVTSAGATQTDWVVVTVSAPSRRSLPNSRIEALPEARPRAAPAWTKALHWLVRGLAVIGKGSNGGSLRGIERRGIPAGNRPTLEKRQVSVGSPLIAQTSTTTVTAFVTQTAIFTSPTTVTIPSTSVVQATVSQTRVFIYNAQATVIATSTYTYHPPSTFVVTITASQSSVNTPAAAATTPNLLPPASIIAAGSSSSGPSTTTIAGAAVGASVVALICSAVVIFYCRNRRKRQSRIDEDDPYPNDENGQPRVPSISEAQSYAPISSSHSDRLVAKSSVPSTYSSVRRPPVHRRNSSGITTLVGMTTPVTKQDWQSNTVNLARDSSLRTSQSSSIPSSPGFPPDEMRAYQPSNPPQQPPIVVQPAPASLPPQVPLKSHARGRSTSTSNVNGWPTTAELQGNSLQIPPRLAVADDGRTNSIMSDDTAILARHAQRTSYQNVNGQWVAVQPTYRLERDR